MKKRLVLVFGMLTLFVLGVSAFAASPDKMSCKLPDSAPRVSFDWGLENCSQEQDRELYRFLAQAKPPIQELSEGDEFSINIPYEVGICTDGFQARITSSNLAPATVYCGVACQCTPTGDHCEEVCVIIWNNW